MPAQRVIVVSRDPGLVNDERLLALGGGGDHPKRHPLLADVVAEPVEVHQPSERRRQKQSRPRSPPQ